MPLTIRKFLHGFLIALLGTLVLLGFARAFARSTDAPALQIPENIPAQANASASIPVALVANGSEIATITFAVDYDETWLAYEPNWDDSFTFNLPDDTVGSCSADTADTDGEITCVVFNQSNPWEPIPDGVFLTIKLRTLNAPGGTLAPVGFSQDPAVFFGGTDGNEISGIGIDGSVRFETRSWQSYLPLLAKQPPPTATPTPTPTPGPTPTPTPTPGCENIIINGDFEDRDDDPDDGWGWELPVTSYSAQFTREKRYDGDWSLRTGIINAAENIYSYSSGEQTFAIPASATSAMLTFWNYPISEETALTRLLARMHYRMHGITPDGPNAYDIQYVAIQDLTTNTGWEIIFSQISNAHKWQPQTVDLSAYIGHTVRLRFTTYNDGYDGVTAMYVDHVSVEICTTR